MTLQGQDFNPYKHLEIGKNPDDLQKDKEYDEKGKYANPETIKKIQEEAKAGLYGVFNAPEKKSELQDENIETEAKDENSKTKGDDFDIFNENTITDNNSEGVNKNKQENFSQLNEEENNEIENILELNSPYTPIIKELYDEGNINKIQFNEIAQKINSTNKLDENRKDFLHFIHTINNKDIQENIVNSFTKQEEITKDNIGNTDFMKNSGNLIDIGKGIGGLEISLAKNYVNFIDNEGHSNKEKNINICIDTTLNSIISKNSQIFLEANGDIIDKIRQETNGKGKYKLLQKLYKNDLLDDAKKGGKKAKEEIRMKKESIKLSAEKISQEFKEAKSIKNEEIRNKKIQELEQQKQSIIQEAKGVDDVEKDIKTTLSQVNGLSGGKIDTHSEKLES